jgi:hypothetical protein
MKEALQFLRAYADDLRYTISQRSVDVVNFNTSGTPCFETLQDAKIYRQKLLNVIRELEKENSDEWILDGRVPYQIGEIE